MHTIRKALLLLCNLESTGSYLINRHMKHKISPILYIAGIFLLFATCTRHPMQVPCYSKQTPCCIITNQILSCNFYSLSRMKRPSLKRNE